ncbi:MAG: GNAT family N-acetyltransferase [Acidimicrobiales bacterium]
MVQVARARPEDLAAIAARVSTTFATAAQALTNVDGSVDLERVIQSLGGAHVWVARRGSEIVGHLAASLVPRGPRSEAWISPDAWSCDDVDDLAALYAHAAPAWLAEGVRDHVVWSFDLPAWTDAWGELGFAHELRRGARFAAGVPGEAPPGYRLRRARFDPVVAARLSALVDAAEESAPVFRPHETDLDEGSAEAPGHWYVAESAGRVVAQCLAIAYPPTLGIPLGTVHLSALAVTPSHRRHGVARSLVAYAARRERVAVVDATWRSANRPAHRFWVGAGFAPVAVGLRRQIPT